MQAFIRALLRYRNVVLIVFVAVLALGAFALTKLDIEAYPDPAPPMVDFITQNPSWAAEEMEKQVTIPVETGLFGTPGLTEIRSTTIFGLSDVTLFFKYGSNYFTDLQWALDRLQQVSLPDGLQPQVSPESPTGEIYRYQIVGPQYTLNQLTSEDDWFVVPELEQVPGIIGVATFGGTTREYEAEVNPNKLHAFGVTMEQVINAIQASNADAGGNYMTLGSQSVNVRGIGLLQTLDQMRNVVVAERNGTPVLLSDVATVREWHVPRLGIVGRDIDGHDNPDIVQGIVLLQINGKSKPTLVGLRKKIHELNTGNLLPPGMHLSTIYDRTKLIDLTTRTVRHIVYFGLVLVTLVLFFTLGDVGITVVAALTIPFAVLFAFGMMVTTNQSANLISIGAIDFGILVDASIVVLESVYRKVSQRVEGQSVSDLIAEGVSEAAQPVLFATFIIIVAFLPLFTMQGVPGKIFSPMSITYGFALAGALIFALLFAPALSSFAVSKQVKKEKKAPWLTRKLRGSYERALTRTLRSSKLVWTAAAIALIGGIIVFHSLGSEFMPTLAEGNIWLRATMQPDISFQQSDKLTTQIRQVVDSFPEVTEVVSQMGRPDDGSDVSTFNNAEFNVELKPKSQWRPQFHENKDTLIAAMQKQLNQFPGVVFNFSQNIQDNVDEAMSGVKGTNSVKLFGDNLNTLESIANQMAGIMKQVPGVKNVGVFDVTGQPTLMISIDRAKAARYGLKAQDVNDIVSAAIGGAPVTTILQGDRRFAFAVRYAPQFRSTPEEIGNILVSTPDGGDIPLSSIADIKLSNGAFSIFRQGGRRFIPIKFSVRGRPLSSTVQNMQARLKAQVKLPRGYNYVFSGEYNSLVKEQRRLAVIVPLSIIIILVLLYIQFRTWTNACIVVATLPFAAIGGVLSLWITRTPFSISAAVGFTSLTGVATLCAVVFLEGIRRNQRLHGSERGLFKGCVDEMRPVVMACMAAGFGLLPAAIATGIGSQTQRPLARVIVGGMVTTLLAVLFVMPLMARRKEREPSAE